jgi:pyridoxine kinase
MSVISIQSHVLHGHVGNSAAVFPLQLAGNEVAAVPTTLLSNHPAYPTVHGTVLDAELVRQLLVGLEERGVVEASSVLMTGYIGSAEIAEVVVDFVTRAKARNPSLIYVCDPVMGDTGPGFYVKPAVREAIAGKLVPLADVITPNRFEFDFLTGRQSGNATALLAAARTLGKRTVLVTGGGAPLSEGGGLETYAVEQGGAWRVATPKLVCKASGTGDLLTALFVANILKGKPTPVALGDAVSGVFGVLEATAEKDGLELDLVRASGRLFGAERRFMANVIGE